MKKINKNHLAFLFTRKDVLEAVYNERNPKLLEQLALLDFNFFKQIYKALLQGDKEVYVPTFTYMAEASHFFLTENLDYKSLKLPSDTGILAIEDYACCFARIGDLLLVSVQMRNRTNYGVIGYMGCNILTSDIIMNNYIAGKPDIKDMLLGVLHAVLYMGLKQHEVKEVKAGGKDAKSGLRNLSKQPFKILDKSLHTTYLVPETKVQEYQRKQWYGPKGDKRCEIITINAHFRKEHKRKGKV